MGYISRILKAAVGLMLFGLGGYMTIQANVGLAPWDVFSMGVSMHVPLSFGTITIITSFIILLADVLIGERIGIGMIMDSLIVGSSIDLFTALGMIPKQTDPVIGTAMVLAGLVIMGFASYLYMSAGLGCGPRDTLMVGLGKRMRRVPIGFVKVLMDAVVLSAGWLLGGPVGLGTVVSVAGAGLAMQAVYRLFRFEPRDVVHEDIITSVRNMARRLKRA